MMLKATQRQGMLMIDANGSRCPLPQMVWLDWYACGFGLHIFGPWCLSGSFLSWLVQWSIVLCSYFGQLPMFIFVQFLITAACMQWP